MVRCPNCGQKTEGDYCRWCGYPVLAGGSGGVEARKSSSKLKGCLKGCGCLLTLAVIVGIIIALNSHGNPNYIYENGGIHVGGDGEPIELIDNLNATDPTYAELVAFIVADSTDTNAYLEGGPRDYVCSDFAEDVHNNAEAAGIRAAWVSIDFEGNDEGHACNAFETTDRGLVYIDCTGGGGSVYFPVLDMYLDVSPLLKTPGSVPELEPASYDTIAYIEIGEEYGLIDIAKAKSLSYSFYEEYKQKWQEYESKLETYNREVERYNQEILGKVYIIGSSEDIRISAWEARLEEESQALDKLAEELGDFWFEPLGVVTDIHIHWGGKG